MTASRTAIRRRRGSSSTTMRDDIDVRVGVDEGLDHPLAERAVAQDRRRDDAPAARLGDVPGGDLAPRQRAVRESRRAAARRSSACRSRPSRPAAPGLGHVRVTVTSIALFDDPTIRPTISTSPSPRASQRRRAVEHGTPGLVDVVAVAPRADVALRIERRAAQRARRPARGDDPGGARHERPRGVGDVMRTRSRSGPSSSSSSSSSGSIARRPRPGPAPRAGPAPRRRPSRASASRPGTPR